MKPGQFSFTAGGSENGTTTLEGSAATPRRAEHVHTPLFPRNPILESSSQTLTQGDVYQMVHCNDACNLEKLELP